MEEKKNDNKESVPLSAVEEARTSSVEDQQQQQQKPPEGENARQMYNYTVKQEKRLLRKIDVNLLIILGALYAFALIDRSNLSNAAVSGMIDDMHMEGTDRYSIISLVFFIPYILVEIPCNVLVRKVRPRWILGSLGILWGAVMTGMGFATHWSILAICRVLLGAFEGGYFPACAFLIQSWYVRREVQKRLAAFYVLSVMAGGFSNILAWGLTTLEGTHGIRGWRWIFIAEGAMTMGVGVLCLFLVQDFPDKTSRFLNETEMNFIRQRIQDDRGDVKSDSMRNIMKHMLDYKLWMYGLMFMGSTAPAYALGYFLTLILNGMGYNIRDSQLLSAPPSVFAVFSAMTFSYFSDRYWCRAPFIIAQSCMVIVGMCMIAFAGPNAARYVGAFIAAAGCQGLVPSVLAYSANNICSYSKRACSTAITVSFGAVGGIYATTTFRDQDAPRYHEGTYAVIATQIMIIAFTTYLSTTFYRENKRLDEGKRTEPIEGTPGFKYTY